MIEKINIAETFSQIPDYENPRVAADVNETAVKFVKLKGDFVWHQHEAEDELFLVVKGRLCMKLRTGDMWVNEGEMIMIPRGTEHCPVAPEEVHIILIEQNTTVNTGNIVNERTKVTLDRI
jgi:mannose-6-phosphate isomerase-like protein (cupin superfamily)